MNRPEANVTISEISCIWVSQQEEDELIEFLFNFTDAVAESISEYKDNEDLKGIIALYIVELIREKTPIKRYKGGDYVDGFLTHVRDLVINHVNKTNMYSEYEIPIRLNNVSYTMDIDMYLYCNDIIHDCIRAAGRVDGQMWYMRNILGSSRFDIQEYFMKMDNRFYSFDVIYERIKRASWRIKRYVTRVKHDYLRIGKSGLLDMKPREVFVYDIYGKKLKKKRR